MQQVMINPTTIRPLTAPEKKTVNKLIKTGNKYKSLLPEIKEYLKKAISPRG